MKKSKFLKNLYNLQVSLDHRMYIDDNMKHALDDAITIIEEMESIEEGKLVLIKRT